MKPFIEVLKQSCQLKQLQEGYDAPITLPSTMVLELIEELETLVDSIEDASLERCEYAD